MWFQKLGRERTRAWPAAAGMGAALLVAFVSVGCTPSYVTSSDASVNLIVAAINGGNPLSSDIRIGSDSSTVCPDVVSVAVAVRNKNPNAPVPSLPSAVVLQSYEVRYFRTDGLGVEGVDVPYRITGSLSFSIDVASSGTTNVPIEVVRRQAKLEPPLSSINQANILTLMAQVTLYGQTVAGQRVSASGSFQIDFADYADTLTSCPTTTS
ncbi:MAG TPA: hypothetical protein VMX54_07195 [Vicinamibacteria bacterium]|nr:hypothetical protein [Vicinamibacteria bacterium]